MLTLDPDKVCHIVVKARALDAGLEFVDDDPDSALADEATRESYDEDAADATGAELAAFIRGLNVDEQAELVVLAWIGRGSCLRAEWAEAMRDARHAHAGRVAEYLLAMPLLGDYLADGLAEFGHRCDE